MVGNRVRVVLPAPTGPSDGTGVCLVIGPQIERMTTSLERPTSVSR
jgi:hypothetical protein